MVDVLTPEQRRLNMSRIRGRDTKPEMLIRRGIHALGMRYRLHNRDLPGSPDLVLRKFNVVIFVHGCFWHGHDCPMFRIPSTRTEFWTSKIEANRARDERTQEALLALGWRILTVWECCLRGVARREIHQVLDECRAFIVNDERQRCIEGSWLVN
jgi:DNA mismatch endonuclease (patch repair protein)